MLRYRFCLAFMIKYDSYNMAHIKWRIIFNMEKSNVPHVTSFSVQFAIPKTIRYPQSTLRVRRAKIQVRKKYHRKSKKQNAVRKTKTNRSNFGTVRMIGVIIL